MLSKTSYLALAMSLLHAQQARAAFGDASYTLWSGTDCGTDDSTAFTESSSTPSLVDPDDTSSCSKTYIGLEGFSMVDGKYQAFANPTFLKEGCMLIFYDKPPAGDDRPFNCDTGIPVQAFTKGSGCAPVMIPQQFVTGQCCGEICNNYLPMDLKKRDVKQLAPAPRDVAAVKRAPIHNNKKRGECNFNKTGDAKVRFMGARKTGQSVKCDGKTDCPVTGDYSATAGVSHSVSDTDSISTGVSGGNPFFQVTASYGHDHTVTDETNESQSFSQSYTLNIPKGSSGYMTFMPKMLCGEGTWEGDGCDDSLKNAEDNQWCVPALTSSSDGKTIPDGLWSVFAMY